MASRKSKSKSKKKCTVCGGPVQGKEKVCSRCSAPSKPDSAVRRVAEKVRDRLAGGETGLFVCPFCRFELSWETLGTAEVEVTIYVREKIYYCPSCRGFLGVSSWHTEG